MAQLELKNISVRFGELLALSALGSKNSSPPSFQNTGFVFYSHHETSKRSQMPKLQLIRHNSF